LQPILSLAITLGLTGVIAVLLHLLIVWLGVGDLVALMIFAAPISAYLAYCTHHSNARRWRAAGQIYASFCSVVLASAAIVYYIG
jgi:hypothetical protein